MISSWISTDFITNESTNHSSSLSEWFSNSSPVQANPKESQQLVNELPINARESPASTSAISSEELSTELINWIQSSKPNPSQVFFATQDISSFPSIEILTIFGEFLKSENPLLREGATRGVISYINQTSSEQAMKLLANVANADPSSELRRLAQESYEILST